MVDREAFGGPQRCTYRLEVHRLVVGNFRRCSSGYGRLLSGRLDRATSTDARVAGTSSSEDQVALSF